MVSHLITLASILVCLKAQSLVPYYFLSTLMILRKILNRIFYFFADDTMLFSVVNNSAISKNELNHEVISQWAYQWKMNFNPDLNEQATTSFS